MASRVIQFEVDCVPVAQPRPRAAYRGNHVNMYEAPSGHAVFAFKAQLRIAWSMTHHDIIEGPIVAVITAVFPRKAFPKRFGTDRIPRDTKPDVDNLTKSVLDALNGIAYKDDSQIWQVCATKYYAAVDEKPGVRVTFCYGACTEIPAG